MMFHCQICAPFYCQSNQIMEYLDVKFQEGTMPVNDTSYILIGVICKDFVLLRPFGISMQIRTSGIPKMVFYLTAMAVEEYYMHIPHLDIPQYICHWWYKDF